MIVYEVYIVNIQSELPATRAQYEYVEFIKTFVSEWNDQIIVVEKYKRNLIVPFEFIHIFDNKRNLLLFVSFY